MIDTPRAVFFDLDETIITNNLGIEQLLARLSDDHLGHLVDTRLRKFLDQFFLHANNIWNRLSDDQKSNRHPLVDCFATACTDVGQDPAVAPVMFEDFLRYASEATCLNGNASTTLDCLKSLGIITGIITNGFEVLQMAKITYHHLDRLVDGVVVSERAGAHKPDRKIFDYALEKFQVEAKFAWHVGDHVHNDVAGAINSGLTGIFYDPEKLGQGEQFTELGVQPNFIIHDLKDLTDLLA